MPRICIVSPFAYGALLGGRHGHAGGVEQQTTMLARWLAARGHDVSLVTWAEGQPDGARVHGVRVLTLCGRDQGLPGLRFVHPRWTSLVRAMHRADAEVYYQNCGDYVTGQVAAWCRARRRPFVYSVASDPDCDGRLPKLPALRERVLYRYGLRRADRIIVQTDRQQQMLQAHFGLPSTVLPMPCALLPDGDAPGPADARLAAPRVLWVGRLAPVKRFDVLLDIARLMPDVAFDIAGKPDTVDAAARALAAAAAALPNVHMRGLVPRDAMPALYRSAAALLCTSDYEGFPNTFLEAWSLGVPVISTVDPDGVIGRHELGAPAATAADAVRELRRLFSSAAVWNRISERSRRYFNEHHHPDRALPPFERVLLEVVPGAGRPAPVSS